jgi:hypothetical protein
MAPRVLQNWNDEVHTDILLAIVEHVKFGSQDWKNVVIALQEEKGYTFTEGAVQ